MAFTCTIPAVPTVLADDDRVRITRWDFMPGATTGWHEHAMNYAVVMVTDGTMAVDVDGEVTRIARRPATLTRGRAASGTTSGTTATRR